MAKLVEDAVAVQKWVEEKQQLEVMLAWDLLERFNTHKKLIGDLRLMAQYAVLDMSRMPRDSVDQAILEESGRPNMQYLNNQIVSGASVRSYYTTIAPPRAIGVRFSWDIQ